MAETFFCGWETKDAWTESAGNLDFTGSGMSFETSIVRSGFSSLKASAVSGVSGTHGVLIGSGNFHKIHVRVTAGPASTARVLIGSITSASIRLNPNGTLAYYDGVSLIGTSSVALTDTNKWYMLQWRTGIFSSSVALRIDNIEQITGTTTSATHVAAVGPNDTVADTYTAYFDDYARDDASFPVDSKSVLLLPISDNARATLWTGGVGGTTNLWDAVNNTPPIGTATETDLTQIEHAGGAAGTTDSYDANMTKYSSFGIKTTDVIRAVYFIEADGEDSGTGSKLLNFEVLSNPAIASPGNVTAGNDAGALGTYHSAWAVRDSPLVLNPSVDVNTSPVMRVRRPETANRVASVCFMGIYVDYVPMGEKCVCKNQAVSRAASF